jgi:hypothetical protein
MLKWKGVDRNRFFQTLEDVTRSSVTAREFLEVGTDSSVCTFVYLAPRVRLCCQIESVARRISVLRHEWETQQSTTCSMAIPILVRPADLLIQIDIHKATQLRMTTETLLLCSVLSNHLTSTCENPSYGCF